MRQYGLLPFALIYRKINVRTIFLMLLHCVLFYKILSIYMLRDHKVEDILNEIFKPISLLPDILNDKKNK